jgi:hypothetical protein
MEQEREREDGSILGEPSAELPYYHIIMANHNTKRKRKVNSCIRSITTR